MGLMDRLFGRRQEPERRRSWSEREYGRPSLPLTDEQAVERYRYMLRTAPPDAIERAHEEAFAQLTSEQRRMALQELTRELPDYERASAGVHADDPRTLARLATRAEMRQPGFMERTLGGVGTGGIGMGGLIAGSLLSSLAGAFIGTAIAEQFFDNDPGFTDAGYSGADYSDQGAGEESFEAQGADVADFGGGDFGGGGFGGEF